MLTTFILSHSQTIADMRKYVREKHEDIRMNDRCAKTMFEFLRKAESGEYVPGQG